jgi:hypothetical protein
MPQDPTSLELIQFFHSPVDLLKINEGHNSRGTGSQVIADFFQEIVFEAQVDEFTGRSATRRA